MTEPTAMMIPPGFQAVDQAVVNSTVFVWSHHLTWPLNANADYAYESLILFSADAESGFRYRITVPDDVQSSLSDRRPPERPPSCSARGSSYSVWSARPSRQVTDRCAVCVQ